MRASLPMYDLPEVRDHTDRLWTAIAEELRGLGVANVPDMLESPADHHDAWRPPGLLLSQSCGYPVATALRDAVRVVATPHYAAIGCDGPRYRSSSARDDRLLLDGAGTQGGPGHRQPLEHDRQHVEPLDLRPALHRDDHEPALDGETFQVPRHVVAGHHVEHHVHATPTGERADVLDEVLVAVVDGRVGSEGEAGGERLRELDRGGADAARSAVHENRLAFGEVGAIEDVGPYREEGLGQGRGLDGIESAGDGQAARARRSTRRTRRR